MLGLASGDSEFIDLPKRNSVDESRNYNCVSSFGISVCGLDHGYKFLQERLHVNRASITGNHIE